MITDVLPQLPDRPPDAPTGYQATALSASSLPPRPGSPGPVSPGLSGAVRPRAPQPGESAFAYQPTVVKPPGPPAADAGPLGGVQPSAAQTAPTAPQPSQGSRGPGASSGYAPGAAGSAPGSSARPEGRPPDFASWYNQSPRGGASPGGQGGSGSGYRPPAGYGPPGWSGQASQQAQGSPAWSGGEYAPSRRKRSGLGWKAAVAALAIIGAAAGAATVVLLHQNHSGSPQGQTTGTGSASGSASGSTSGSSSATLPPPTLQIIDAINKPATGPLPSGFTRTTQPAAANGTAGFSIAAPTSWQKSTNGSQTYLRDPADPNTNILIDLTPHTYRDMLQEAQYIEARSIPRFPGYHRVGMASMLVRGASGAWWKFTWNNQGVQQEALDVLFVAHTSAGPQSYALYMTAPESKFDQARPIFDEEMETFATLPS